MVGTSSGLGGFMSGASIRFSKYKGGTGGADAWRDGLAQKYQRANDRRPRTTGTKLPKLNSIHSGTVVSMQPFGAFLQLGDGEAYKDGLLHVSCLGEARVESPEEAGLEQGMRLWVKVTEVKEDELKYGLDMRYVSQRDGTDLDPYQTKGRLPDNFFAAGRVKALPSKAEPPAAPVPETSARKPEAAAAEAEASASDGSDDPEERAKVSKKLEKARKKLEKARKQAEKVKKKLEKKAKKGRKDKKAKASPGAPASSGASSA